MNKKTIIANWKMNGSFDDSQIWVDNLSQKLAENKNQLPEIILCPPTIMIDFIDELFLEKEFERIENLQGSLDDISEDELEKLIATSRKVKIGGQNCHPEIKGAFTGSTSAKMLKDCGAKFVILGHSECRKYFNESDEIISKKTAQAINCNLTPIICVGEPLSKRSNGEYTEYVTKQIQNSIPKNLDIKQLILAYEPIWSIGTGKTPTSDEIEDMAKIIDLELSKNHHIKNYKILYGGSVNCNNAAQISLIKNIDGLLVGGASLDSDEFFKIIQRVVPLTSVIE